MKEHITARIDSEVLAKCKALAAADDRTFSNWLGILLAKTVKPKSTSKAMSINDCVSFAEFWAIYPKKKDAKKCEAKWKRMNVDHKLFNVIKCHLTKAYASTEKKYIPGPLPYLNGEKWNDEITSTQSTPHWMDTRCDQTKDAFNTYDGELN